MTACDGVLRKGMAVLVCAVTVAAGGTALAGVAQAEATFNGTYSAVLKSPGQPDQVRLWNVSSICGYTPCLAHVVNASGGSDWLYDGSQWTRLAVSQTGPCNGATVPARSASEFLVPRADGSLSGAMNTSVDCNGVTVNLSQSLTLTPSP